MADTHGSKTLETHESTQHCRSTSPELCQSCDLALCSVEPVMTVNIEQSRMDEWGWEV